MMDELRRYVNRGHLYATLGDEPRVVALTSADVQPAKAICLWQYLQDGGRIQVIAGEILAHASERRPRICVPVPELADFAIAQRSTPA